MKPYSLARDEGEAVWMFDALDTIKADADHTGGAFSVIEFLDFQGSSVPLHINETWDRGFYVLDGEYTFVIEDRSQVASAGTWVFVPRKTRHAWRCNAPRGRILNVTVPAGFERFYRHVGQSVTDRAQLPAKTEPEGESLSVVAAQYGIAVVGPPPTEG